MTTLFETAKKESPVSELPQKIVPRKFGGKQEGGGRPPKPQGRLVQISVSVEPDLRQYLQSLPRQERLVLYSQAVRVLRMAEIESRKM